MNSKLISISSVLSTDVTITQALYIVARINVIKTPIEYSLDILARSLIDLPIAPPLFEVVAEAVAIPLPAGAVAEEGAVLVRVL